MLPRAPHIVSHLRAVPAADRGDRLALLHRQLAELERHAGHPEAACLSLGAPEIHAHLPTPGLIGGVLHEVAGATYGDRPAAFGFVVALMAVASDAAWTLSPHAHFRDGERVGVKGSHKGRPLHEGLLGRRSAQTECRQAVERLKPVPIPLPALRGEGGANPTGPAFLVVTRRALAHLGRPYGRGLGQAGLDPGRLILVETRSDKEALWALEEVLASDARPCVVAGAIETPLGLTESRRLNLAAARHGTPLLALGAPGQTGASAAATRWRIAAAPAGSDRFSMPVRPRWHVALERCRHGRPGEWLIEWDHAAYRFRLAQGLADRTPAAGARLPRRAG